MIGSRVCGGDESIHHHLVIRTTVKQLPEKTEQLADSLAHGYTPFFAGVDLLQIQEKSLAFWVIKAMMMIPRVTTSGVFFLQSLPVVSKNSGFLWQKSRAHQPSQSGDPPIWTNMQSCRSKIRNERLEGEPGKLPNSPRDQDCYPDRFRSVRMTAAIQRQL